MNAKLPHAQRRFRARRHVGSLGLVFFFLGTLRAHLEDTQKSPNGSRVGSAASVSFPRRTAH